MEKIILTIEGDDIVQLYRRMVLLDLQNDDMEITQVRHNNKTFKFDKNNKPKDWLKKAKQGQWANKEK